MSSRRVRPAYGQAGSARGGRLPPGRCADRRASECELDLLPHAQYVVHARIASIGDASPEDLEMVGESKLFTMRELRALNDAGEFDDGLTLAALALCGLSL